MTCVTQDEADLDELGANEAPIAVLVRPREHRAPLGGVEMQRREGEEDGDGFERDPPVTAESRDLTCNGPECNGLERRTFPGLKRNSRERNGLKGDAPR